MKPQATPPHSRITIAAAVTRSGVRRYPKELACTLRGPSYAPISLPDSQVAAAAAAPLSAVWLGHASVLLRLGGQWVLTDPVFSHRIGVSLGPVTLGVGRRAPSVDPSTLPPIDLILISHAHFDHLDKPTLRRLVTPATRVITAQNTRRLIPSGFGEVTELHWDQTLGLGAITIGAFRPKHWGARTAWDRHRGFNSYLLESRGEHARRVLYAGDTAFTDAYRGVAGPAGVDLSIFGIGAYDPWIAHHATPEQVWSMNADVGGRYLLPIHHSTFKLSDEPWDEPLERLLAISGNDAHRVVGRELGQVWRQDA